MIHHDLIVIGAGPAGSTCAALCARQGMNVLLLDASRFPRDKVCGDCLNPDVWPVLDNLGVSAGVRKLPHSSPGLIRFSIAEQGSVEISISRDPGEFVVRRRDFDDLLLRNAIAAGVEFQDGTPVSSLRKHQDLWEVNTAVGEIRHARRVVAADGRNSAVGRHLRLISRQERKDRVGLQSHIPHPQNYDGNLEMRLYRNGYGGMADLGHGLANLCLVANSGRLRELRKEAEEHYRVHEAIAWRSITPIGRAKAISIARGGVFLCGDAARVVEPFTGEGISFALRSGELLAEILTNNSDVSTGNLEKDYRLAHPKLYAGRLRVNKLTRFFSEHPRLAHRLAPILISHPRLLSYLTYKVL
jgi:geranylgeranyl reductase family protein